jgi:hypothetical protein
VLTVLPAVGAGDGPLDELGLLTGPSRSDNAFSGSLNRDVSAVALHEVQAEIVARCGSRRGENVTVCPNSTLGTTCTAGNARRR